MYARIASPSHIWKEGGLTRIRIDVFPEEGDPLYETYGDSPFICVMIYLLPDASSEDVARKMAFVLERAREAAARSALHSSQLEVADIPKSILFGPSHQLSKLLVIHETGVTLDDQEGASLALLEVR